MADAKIDMALDDIIKKNRAGGNRRGRGGRGTNSLNRGIQRRGAGGQRGNRGRVGKIGGRGGRRGGGGRNSFNQPNNNRFNNVRQQRGGNNNFRGLNRASPRRNFRGDNPTATYNPLSRDIPQPKQQQQQQQRKPNTPRPQQGSNIAFNKIRNNGPQQVTALRRRMVAAQRALNRATKTLASMPRLKLQRQKFLQHPQKLSNLITRNKVARGGIQKRLSTGRKGARGKAIGRGRGRRTFV